MLIYGRGVMGSKSIAINGVNSNSAGGRRILLSYLQFLDSDELNDDYFLLTSRPEEFYWISNQRINVVPLSRKSSGILTPIYYEVFLKKVLKKHQADIVLNLGDLIINTTVKQVYFFDWRYLTSRNNNIWSMMSPTDRLKRELKFFLIKKRICQPEKILVQTKEVSEELVRIFGVSNVEIVPGGYSRQKLRDLAFNFNLPNGPKLLYLTHYYVHKNLEIFLPLANLIRKRNLGFKLIITIDQKQNEKAKLFLESVKRENLEDIIINLGTIEQEQVSCLYQQCDALLMPTLLETFGLPYLEAMDYSLPILTSDLSFAREVCGESAIFFDPNNEYDILDKIIYLFNEPGVYKSTIIAGKKRLNNFPDWERVYERIQLALQDTLKTCGCN